MGIGLFTSTPLLSQVMNTAIIKEHGGSGIIGELNGFLWHALAHLPPYEGEVFLGANGVNRSLFPVGKKVSWPVFLSGSAVWRVALESAPDFDAKAKKGTVFILKGKSGRFVGQHSQFSFDSEVVFSPFTEFKVTNWYHGDVTALGQANIREHTFKVKDEETTSRMNTQAMLKSDRSLIIELEEL